ncbi:MAG: AAA family ATPase, partial [Treponema sp.]|nr:AAA family ATPase [Treponema sp.]
SDVNNFSGIEIVRYGANINTILDRKSFTHQSILLQYENAISVFETYYQYEEIKGAFREKKELVPLKAFREAIANAIVHRVYDIDANISVFMFDDRIEIISPGGLPHGVRREDYLKGGISIFRNHIIGNLFLRLCMIEKLGTGIRRINESYSSSMKMPSFDTSENSIRITLPVLVKKNNLSLDENKIYDALKNQNLSSSIIAEKTGYGKTKTVSILNKFLQEGYIVSTGKGRAKRYQLKQNI